MVQVSSLTFPEILLIQRNVYADDRGFFTELFRNGLYADEGVDCPFVQDNLSFSKKGVVRGMHFQSRPGQAKLITCLSGELYDVFVDIRRDSENFGKWGAYRLKGESGDQLFIPVGFAHGFACLSDEALVMYKVSSLYNAETEKGFRYDDPEIGIEWPVRAPVLSDRDRMASTLQEVLDCENIDLRCGRAAR